VGVGADQRVGISGAQFFIVEDDPGQALDVDLVDDAGIRRYDLEIIKRGLAPAQERITPLRSNSISLLCRNASALP
jgi:hypothetical protein